MMMMTTTMMMMLQSDVRHAYLQALLHGPPVYIGRKPAMRFSERVRPTADTFGSPANNESTEIYFFHGCDHTTTHWAVNRVEAIAGIESSMKPSAFIRTAAASKIFSYSCGHGRLQWPPDRLPPPSQSFPHQPCASARPGANGADFW